jgi:hypothetical protein
MLRNLLRILAARKYLLRPAVASASSVVEKLPQLRAHVRLNISTQETSVQWKIPGRNPSPIRMLASILPRAPSDFESLLPIIRPYRRWQVVTFPPKCYE